MELNHCLGSVNLFCWKTPCSPINMIHHIISLNFSRSINKSTWAAFAATAQTAQTALWWHLMRKRKELRKELRKRRLTNKPSPWPHVPCWPDYRFMTQSSWTGSEWPLSGKRPLVEGVDHESDPWPQVSNWSDSRSSLWTTHLRARLPSVEGVEE